MRLVHVIAVILATPLHALAEPVSEQQVDDAQIKMLSQNSEVIEAYAKELGLDADFVSFCRIEMGRETGSFPANGLYPFGMNYKSIKNQRALDSVITLRGAYERSYMRLCLARSKATMDGAYPKQ